MQRVASALDRLPAPVPLTIPRALHYDSQSRFLLQTAATGIAFPQLQDLAGDEHWSLTGRALACLHALDAVHEPAVVMSDHIEQLIRPHPLRLIEQFPEFEAPIRRCLDWLLDEQASWANQVRPCLIHRDFHLRQLWQPSRSA
jgi:aminoglycoside phosphotransferase (APT) family kinase protein